MNTVQIEEARRTIGELVDLARLAGEPTLIMRNRKPGAVLVPVSWYEDAIRGMDAEADGPATAPEEAANR